MLASVLTHVFAAAGAVTYRLRLRTALAALLVSHAGNGRHPGRHDGLVRMPAVLAPAVAVLDALSHRQQALFDALAEETVSGLGSGPR